jgi:NTE family protein
VLGAAWSIGALCALQDELGIDPRECELVIGTSAGSVLAALVGAGVPTHFLRDHQRGIALPQEGGPDEGADVYAWARSWDYDSDTGDSKPALPRLGIGSPHLLLRQVRHPLHYPPLSVLAAVTPPGSGDLRPIGRMVGSLETESGWVARDGVWICAMDYDTGKRVAFGREGSPPAHLGAAAMASCAIPGWYAPVTIGGRKYVDGGACSTTSADLAAGHGLDEVYVLAPMASYELDQPQTLGARLERGLRRRIARRLTREAAKVSTSGARVTVLTPGADDLAAMGANLMDPSRRVAVLETSLRTSLAALRAETGVVGAHG